MSKFDALARRPGHHRSLACLVAALVLSVPSTGLILAEEPSKDVSLEWIHKKKDLGIDDPAERMPDDLAWSPRGHLLAFAVETPRYGRVLVVVDPESSGERIVLTGPQLRELRDALAGSAEGLVPASRLTWEQATAPPEPVKPQEGETRQSEQAPPVGDAADKGADEDEENDEGGDRNPDSIADFAWLEKQNRIRVEFDDGRFLFDPASYRVFEDPRPGLPEGNNENVQSSPDDRYAAYTRANDLYAYDFEDGKEIRLTESGSETLLNGKFPWVYWEELMWRRTWRAFEWSPNADSVAFLQYDERDNATYPITDFSDTVPATKTQRYPKVGTPNPSVRLGIASLSSRETRWVDLGEPHEYVIFVGWKPDGSALTVQTLNRRQNRLGLYEVDPRSARGRLVLEETSDTWVDVFEPPRFVEGQDEFVWLSERTGYRHLYLYGEGGSKARALTSGDWEVEQPGFGGHSLFLDSARRRVYFRSTAVSPLERHVYRVALGGGEPRRLTREPGSHTMLFSADGAYWVDRWNSVDVPERIELLDADGTRVALLGEVTPADLAPYRFGKPEMVTIAGPGGLRFHASLLKPFDFDPSRRYPVVAYVYGEPAGQVVGNRWVDDFDMVLINHGFIVFRFDARGTPGRGRPWLDPIYKDQATLPMEDWRAAVAWLEAQPFVDGERLGVWGWSGGGTMTLNLMLRTPGLFQAGAAVAAVSDKRLYDTLYTERYLGVLDESAEGYTKSSPLFAAGSLEGDLLVAHGLSDDNVHAQNAYNLVEALNKADKDYRLYLYPQKKHGIRGDDVRFHLFGRILDFFETTLKPPGEPAGARTARELGSSGELFDATALGRQLDAREVIEARR